MRRLEIKITQEEHELWKNKPKDIIEKEFLNKYDPTFEWRCGCGLYDFNISANEPKAYVLVGNNCD